MIMCKREISPHFLFFLPLCFLALLILLAAASTTPELYSFCSPLLVRIVGIFLLLSLFLGTLGLFVNSTLALNMVRGYDVSGWIVLW